MNFELVLAICSLFLVGLKSASASYCYTCVGVGQMVSLRVENAVCAGSWDYFRTSALKESSGECTRSAGLGEACGAAVDCLGDLMCMDGSCREYKYLELGSPCTENDQCISLHCDTDNTKTCTATEGRKRRVNWDCPGGMYVDETNGGCVQRSSPGSSCGMNYECEYGTFCNQYTQRCTPDFSLQLNDKCHKITDCDFSKGLYCSYRANGTSSCQVFKPTTKICNNKNRCNSNEWCDCASETCQTEYSISAEAGDAHTDLSQCMKQHQCSEHLYYHAFYTPSSCAMVNCSFELCQSLSYINAKCGACVHSNPMCFHHLRMTQSNSSNQLNAHFAFVFVLPLTIAFWLWANRK